MKAEDYHRSMKPLEEACRLAESGWVCLPLPLTGGKLMILLRHVLLVFKIFRISHRRILVREFSTLPLLLVFPLLWPLRKRMWFLIHHNLQWAVRDPLERFGLTMLAKMGARWVLLETQDFQCLEKYNIPSDQNLVLPHPVSCKRPAGRASLSERAVVGVAGYYRPEKGMDDLIELLKKINGCRDSRLPEFGILLGVPNPAAASHLKVETVCTATPAEYQDMLARCDVLVLNGERESYFYRASGPIADAATCGTAVVAPDFPIIGKQVAGIGEVFQGLETGSAGFSLPAALLRSLEAVKAGRYDFEAYCEARTANALASYLNRSNERSEWL